MVSLRPQSLELHLEWNLNPNKSSPIILVVDETSCITNNNNYIDYTEPD